MKKALLFLLTGFVFWGTFASASQDGKDEVNLKDLTDLVEHGYNVFVKDLKGCVEGPCGIGKSFKEGKPPSVFLSPLVFRYVSNLKNFDYVENFIKKSVETFGDGERNLLSRVEELKKKQREAYSIFSKRPCIKDCEEESGQCGNRFKKGFEKDVTEEVRDYNKDVEANNLFDDLKEKRLSFKCDSRDDKQKTKEFMQYRLRMDLFVKENRDKKDSCLSEEYWLKAESLLDERCGLEEYWSLLLDSLISVDRNSVDCNVDIIKIIEEKLKDTKENIINDMRGRRIEDLSEPENKMKMIYSWSCMFSKLGLSPKLLVKAFRDSVKKEIFNVEHSLGENMKEGNKILAQGNKILLMSK